MLIEAEFERLCRLQDYVNVLRGAAERLDDPAARDAILRLVSDYETLSPVRWPSLLQH